MPVTVPQTAGQVPYNSPYIKGSQNPAPEWGWLQIRPMVVGPLYLFGYGLSYTEFSYDNLELSSNTAGPEDTISVTFEVTNTGDRAGVEIPQLYITDEVSSVVTYAQMLKDFGRVSLEPGETKTVTFTITPEKLVLLDKNMKWTVEPGMFTVKIGSSSEDIRLEDELEIAAR